MFIMVDGSGSFPLTFAVLVGMHMLGFSPSMVAVTNIAIVCLGQALSMSRLDLYHLCRQWMLDGQARRTALRALKGILWALGVYLPILAVALLLDARGGGGGVIVPRVARFAALGCTLMVPSSSWRGAFWALRRLVARLGAFLSRQRANATEHVPALFAALGVMAGLCILRWGDHEGHVPPRSPPSGGRPWETVSTDAGELPTGSLFMARLITDFWFCMSICWPLLLATTAVVFLPAGWAEHVFTDDSAGQSPAQASQLEHVEHFALEERHFFANQLLTSQCAVCLERFRLGEMASCLPCRHIFHQDCVLPWLRDRSGTCPTCRATI